MSSAQYAHVSVTVCEQPLAFGTCLFAGSPQQCHDVLASVTVLPDGEGLSVQLCRSPEGRCTCQLPRRYQMRVKLGHRKHCPLFLQHQAHADAQARLRGQVRIGVCTVIEQRHSGRLLLTRRDKSMRSFPGCWVFPGGHVDAGETLAQAAAREIHEEIGLTVAADALSLFAMWESSYPYDVAHGLSTHHHLVFIFHIYTDQLSLPDDDITAALRVDPREVDAVAWLSPDQFAAAPNAAHLPAHVYDPASERLLPTDLSLPAIHRSTTRLPHFIFHNVTSLKSPEHATIIF